MKDRLEEKSRRRMSARLGEVVRDYEQYLYEKKKG